MRTRVLSISLGLVLLAGCATGIKVYKITQQKPVECDWYYNLPKTGFKVTIYVEKKEYIPGIYSQYAKKYLGLDNISSQPIVRHRISNFDVKTFTLCDTSQWYGVEMGSAKTKVDLNFFNPNNQTVLNIDNLDFSQTEKISQPGSIKMNDVMLSLTPVMNLREKSDTIARYVKKDSVFVLEKVVQKQLILKETGDKVEEVAQSLKKIREQKQALINGENDIPYPASTMEFMYNSLTNQENELLRLFTGYWKSLSYSKTFTFEPKVIADSLTHEDNFILCYFSESEGLYASPVNGFVVMYVSLDGNESRAQLSKLNNPVNEKDQKGFAYRIPVVAKLNITDGSRVMYSTMVPVLQWGILKKMTGKEKSVRFNSETFLPEEIVY